MLKVGDQAPDFELLNQDDQLVRLSSFRGKKVVLFFFPRAHEVSSGCSAQACAFRDDFDEIRDANAVVLGVSADKPADLKKWGKNRRLPYDLLSDAEMKAHNLYGTKSIIPFLRTTRSYFLIDENGIIIDEKRNVSASGNSQLALAALKKANATA